MVLTITRATVTRGLSYSVNRPPWVALPAPGSAASSQTVKPVAACAKAAANITGVEAEKLKVTSMKRVFGIFLPNWLKVPAGLFCKLEKNRQTGTVQYISSKYCRLLHHTNDYNYQKGKGGGVCSPA
ncbi:MAG: hypothetical protein GY874_15930 [Desulfobacteraceae bacterium]|nr:hypothetical protein [Desulfobacteraceae bacterium]